VAVVAVVVDNEARILAANEALRDKLRNTTAPPEFLQQPTQPRRRIIVSFQLLLCVCFARLEEKKGSIIKVQKRLRSISCESIGMHGWIYLRRRGRKRTLNE
jgi:hypothetical protein